MPIKQPGKELLHQIPLRFVRERVAGGGKKDVDVSIALIPFIDFLIVLVVFLLMSFSASGKLLTNKESIQMPEAGNTEELEVAPIIQVNPRVVALDGRRVADTESLADSADTERIEPLVEDLETMKRNWSVLHPSKPFPGTVILQADRSVDFRVIKKIMFSAAQAGYGNVSFAVNKESED